MLERLVDLFFSLAQENATLILPLAAIFVCGFGIYAVYKIAMTALQKSKFDD